MTMASSSFPLLLLTDQGNDGEEPKDIPRGECVAVSGV